VSRDSDSQLLSSKWRETSADAAQDGDMTVNLGASNSRSLGPMLLEKLKRRGAMPVTPF